MRALGIRPTRPIIRANLIFSSFTTFLEAARHWVHSFHAIGC